MKVKEGGDVRFLWDKCRGCHCSFLFLDILKNRNGGGDLRVHDKHLILRCCHVVDCMLFFKK